MKRALVLSGGGAKGAVQVGALKFIFERVKPKIPGYGFDIVSGVSVGALNGVMLAMDKFGELEKLWDTIKKEDVYTGSVSICSAIRRVLCGGKSVLGNRPLRKMLHRTVRLGDITQGCDFRFGVVSLVSGEYTSFRPRDFADDRDFANAVLASTSIPVIWEPVGKVATKRGIYAQLVDGGVRNVSPLGDVIDDDPDEIVIINCSPEKLGTDTGASKNMFTIAKRALTEITVDEIFRTDMRQFLSINNIISSLPPGVSVTKPDGTAYKAFRYIKIEPGEDTGDTLDFSAGTIRKRIGLGFELAQKEYEKHYPGVTF